MKDIYNKSISRVKLEGQGLEIKICRGIRQDDLLSPIIFISALQNIVKNLNWERKDININGDKVTFSQIISFSQKQKVN